MKVSNQLSRDEREEIRELYDTGVNVRRSLVEIPEVDADEEFERVMQSVGRCKRHFLTFGWRQAAAAAAVILVVGTVAATAIIGSSPLNLSAEKTTEVEAEPVVETPTMMVYLPDDSVAQGKDVFFDSRKVYEDMTLDYILRDAATLFDVAVECAPEKVDIRFYLSIPSGCTLDELVTILNAFDSIEAEIVTDGSDSQKLVVK